MLRRIVSRDIIKLFLCMAFLSGCSQQSSNPLRLGTNIWPGYEPLYLASAIGQLPRERVRLIEYPSATEVIRAFRNKTLEAASLTLDEALMLVQDGIPLKIILVHDISDGADVIMARPDIRTMKDIKGKRVAVESSALGAFVISRALEMNGLAVRDIKIKHLDVNGHEKAYRNNDVDVVVTFEPVRTKLLSAGAHEIFNSKSIPGEIVDVLVVHEDVYKNNNKQLKELVNSWFAALDYMKDHENEAAKIMAKRLNITPQELIESYSGIKLADRNENITMLDGKSASLHKTIEMLHRVLRENKLIKGEKSNKSLLSAEALK